MNVLQASPLHLISGLINAPLFHVDLQETPAEITIQCIRLLTQLAQDEIFAYHANHQIVHFLSQSVGDGLDDQTYVLVSTDFVRRLQSILSPDDPIWGAIAFVMSSVASRFSTGNDRLIWTRLCALFFDILQFEGVITERDAQRLIAHAKMIENSSKQTENQQNPSVTPKQVQSLEELYREEQAERAASIKLLRRDGLDRVFEHKLKK